MVCVTLLMHMNLSGQNTCGNKLFSTNPENVLLAVEPTSPLSDSSIVTVHMALLLSS